MGGLGRASRRPAQRCGQCLLGTGRHGRPGQPRRAARADGSRSPAAAPARALGGRRRQDRCGGTGRHAVACRVTWLASPPADRHLDRRWRAGCVRRHPRRGADPRRYRCRPGLAGRATRQPVACDTASTEAIFAFLSQSADEEAQAGLFGSIVGVRPTLRCWTAPSASVAATPRGRPRHPFRQAAAERAQPSQALGVVRLLLQDGAVQAAAMQLPLSRHAIRALQSAAYQRLVDAVSDIALHLRLSGKQDLDMNLAANPLGAAVVRRQRARRFVLPVSAQGRRDRRSWGSGIGVRRHRQDGLVRERFPHEATVPSISGRWHRRSVAVVVSPRRPRVASRRDLGSVGPRHTSAEHEENVDTSTVRARCNIEPQTCQYAEGSLIPDSRIGSHALSTERGRSPQDSSHCQLPHPLTAYAPSQPDARFQDPRHGRPLEPNRAHNLSTDQDGPGDLTRRSAEPVPAIAVEVLQPGDPRGRPFVARRDRCSYLVGRRIGDRRVDQPIQGRLVDVDERHRGTANCAHRAKLAAPEPRQRASLRTASPPARTLHPQQLEGKGMNLAVG